MVATLEVKNKLSKKERFQKWWKVEGKVETAGAIVVLVLSILFWNSALIEGALGLTVAIWAFVKIYFRRDQWQLLAILGTWALYQGLSILARQYL